MVVKKFASTVNPLVLSFYRDTGCFPMLFLCALIVERKAMVPGWRMCLVCMSRQERYIATGIMPIGTRSRYHGWMACMIIYTNSVGVLTTASIIIMTLMISSDDLFSRNLIKV